MPDDVACYSRYRFPSTIISYAVWLYYRFSLSFRESVVHDTTRYANNRAEVSHQSTRRRERHMRRFKSAGQGATLPRRARCCPQPLLDRTTSVARRPSSAAALPRVCDLERSRCCLMLATRFVCKVRCLH
jgi:hypothetical protein